MKFEELLRHCVWKFYSYQKSLKFFYIFGSSMHAATNFFSWLCCYELRSKQFLCQVGTTKVVLQWLFYMLFTIRCESLTTNTFTMWSDLAYRDFFTNTFTAQSIFIDSNSAKFLSVSQCYHPVRFIIQLLNFALNGVWSFIFFAASWSNPEFELLQNAVGENFSLGAVGFFETKILSTASFLQVTDEAAAVSQHFLI